MGLFSRKQSASDKGINTRRTWWNAGHIVDYDDHELSHGNLGLDSRARRAISAENNKGWGGTIGRAAIDRRIIDAVPAVKKADSAATRANNNNDKAQSELRKALKSGDRAKIAKANAKVQSTGRTASRANAKLRSERRKAR